jgi:cytochrome P450
MRITPADRHLDLDPRDPAFYRDPYPAYAAIRAACPQFYWEQLGYWCFAAHDDVSALLRDRRFGRQILHRATRDELGWAEPAAHLAPFLAFEQHSLLELEPPTHTRIRAMVNPPFIPRRVERLRPRIAQLAHALIDGFAGQDSVDLLADFAAALPGAVIAGFLGVPDAMVPQLLAWSHDMVAIYQIRRDRAIEDRAVAATVAFSAYVRGVLAERRGAAPALSAAALSAAALSAAASALGGCPIHSTNATDAEETPDTLADLLAARDAHGHPLSDDELVTTVILLLNAGHEATVHAIGNGVAALLTHEADPAAAFLADPVAHVEEMLRFDAPLHLFTRYALEDLEYRGIPLRRGDTVGLLLAAANRDPARYPDPDRYHPSRPSNIPVSLGAGAHACVGAPLARLELQTALRVLFERLPHLRLAGPPVVSDSWHFRGLTSLRVTMHDAVR